MTTRTRRGAPAAPSRASQKSETPKSSTTTPTVSMHKAPRPPKTEKRRERGSSMYDAAAYVLPGGNGYSNEPTKSAQLIADREAARRGKKK